MSIVIQKIDNYVQYAHRKDCTNITRHKWANDVCIKCGIVRKKEYDLEDIKFITRYYDRTGRFISRRAPECCK